ncbi:NTP transferase domain-containing protein [Thalassotalea sp. LPB0316]|uniref:molybdenum cofactor guanylyltransferase n=1 Tax=Thalassotalea sp. LPB0316 TaxID=2769490 RepID=UPI001866EE34|nr:NTP transferase domain-containing protein [Thalassotalea sp. LPB0316]QOL25735.1 NTP transferase domain-containing protein [Thalassotalea sp. LPB0316]
MRGNNTCLGVVLAGGLSSRMGQNKAQLLHPKQQNMLSFSSALLTDVGVDGVVQSIGYNTQPTGANQIADKYPNLGPLGGIATVFETTPHVHSYLILPVDLPLLSAQCLSQLKQVGQLSQMACHFSDHYLPLYLPRTAMTELFFQNLKTSQANASKLTTKKDKSLSIRQLLKQIQHRAIGLDRAHQQQLFNCNTAEQWQQATNQLTLRVNDYE